MKKYILIAIVALVSMLELFADDKKIETKIITYPAPESEKVVDCSYTVSVNGKKLDIYKALSPRFEGGEFYFCYFDFEGQVNVNVHSRKPFTKQIGYTETPEAQAAAAKNYVGEIYPYSLKMTKRERNEMAFVADKPFQAIVFRDNRKLPLIIFGNPLEKDIPSKDDPNVIYYGPGVHYKTWTNLKDNQTLYLAGGAVLKTVLQGRGKNITVRGRGIISTDNRERWTAPCVSFSSCENLKLEGVIIKDPISWTLAIFNSNKVVMDNIKICAGRMINDDAIDICNTSNVRIVNSFARAEDDIIAVKGIYGSGKALGMKKTEDLYHRDNNLPCENIYIENCVFWTDCANVFRIGYECYAPHFKNLKAKNLYIAAYSPVSSIEDYWVRAIFLLQPTGGMPITNMHFENINIRCDGTDHNLIFAEPRIVSYGHVRLKGDKGEFGRVSNCSFKNIRVVGKNKGKWKGLIYATGKDENHKVQNISIKNVKFFGEKITKDSPNVNIGAYTSRITIE